jgi:hypothetical protein
MLNALLLTGIVTMIIGCVLVLASMHWGGPQHELIALTLYCIGAWISVAVAFANGHILFGSIFSAMVVIASGIWIWESCWRGEKEDTDVVE